jgi:hypothetical protein
MDGVRKLDVGGSFLPRLPAEVIHFDPKGGVMVVHVRRGAPTGPQAINILLAEDGYPEVIEIRSNVPFEEYDPDETVWLPMRNVARALSIDVKTARKLAASGKLRAEMINGSWITTREWLAEYASQRRGRGRPRKQELAG